MQVPNSMQTLDRPSSHAGVKPEERIMKDDSVGTGLACRSLRTPVDPHHPNKEPVMVMGICNPSTEEEETGKCLWPTASQSILIIRSQTPVRDPDSKTNKQPKIDLQVDAYTWACAPTYVCTHIHELHL